MKPMAFVTFAAPALFAALTPSDAAAQSGPLPNLLHHLQRTSVLSGLAPYSTPPPDPAGFRSSEGSPFLGQN
jgi:hypothetical protein